jgi:phage terminase large subunit-like protein
LTKYFFDKKAANKAIGFIETFITHTKGELTNKPLKLEKWQSKIVGDIFGWKDKKTNLRKYRTVFIEVPRKNGKSTLCAAIGLYMLFGDEERGSEVYSAAGDRSQWQWSITQTVPDNNTSAMTPFTAPGNSCSIVFSRNP